MLQLFECKNCGHDFDIEGYGSTPTCDRCGSTDVEQYDEETEPEPERRVCPYCNGTTLSPYPDDGGSCPHCFGGYLHD